MAEPSVRFWIGGKVRRAKATVIPAGRPPATTRGFPPAVKALLPFLAPYARAGWAFAFLTPSSTRSTKSKAVRKGAARPGGAGAGGASVRRSVRP